jgi:hypothetical protein
MDKNDLSNVLVSLLRGGLSLSLVITVLEMFLRGPQEKLKKKGIFGLMAAMVLSFLLPYAAKMVYRRLARPQKA